MRGEEEGKERKLGEVKGWDVGRPYVLGRSAGWGGRCDTANDGWRWGGPMTKFCGGARNLKLRH